MILEIKIRIILKILKQETILLVQNELLLILVPHSFDDNCIIDLLSLCSSQSQSLLHGLFGVKVPVCVYEPKLYKQEIIRYIPEMKVYITLFHQLTSICWVFISAHSCLVFALRILKYTYIGYTVVMKFRSLYQ